MSRILMVSKPLSVPWNDSSKNLVRDVASHLRRHTAAVMTRRGSQLPLAGVIQQAVYARTSARLLPGLADNAHVMLRLLSGRGDDLWHFFFAPNPRSSAACSTVAHLRGMPTVQTMCSAPLPDADLRSLLFADRTVVLSRHSESRVLAAGVPRNSLRRIAPAVAPLELPTPTSGRETRAALGLPVDKPLIVYPGDLEFSLGAECMLRTHALLCQQYDLALALACRMKTLRALEQEQRLRALACSLGIEDNVFWIGETPRIHALLGAAEVVALPAETLYAKMDLPLVLIEAMLLGRAVVVAKDTAAAELAEGQAALAVAPDADTLAQSIDRLLSDVEARSELGARARQAALERFHPSIVASAYEALYDELLS